MELILRISLGLVLLTFAACQNGPRRPPNYSQSNMPVTSFSCRDKIIGGYYADPETDCQMFHVCVKVPGLGVQDYKFLCPNNTSFDQENQICDDWFNIDCEASTLYYSDNFDLYRIGSDFGSGRKAVEGPKLPNININNAVSDTQDDDYLQRGDRGESVGSDLLRGSHSGNFFSNKNRGKEDDEDKEEYKKKKATTPLNKTNGVRKLLTGKRLIQSSTTQVPAVSAVSQYSTQPPRSNLAGRNRGTSNFNRNYNQQQQSTVAQPSTTQAPSRAPETYNSNLRQNFNSQRTYYTPTTPKVEISTVAAVASSPRTDFYRGNNNYNFNNNYNYQQQSTAAPQANYYENTQNYNTQSNYNAQTSYNAQSYQAPTNYNAQANYNNNNYQQPSVAPVVSTAAPSSTINSNYETQKLYRLNTAAFNTAPESKYDENNNGEVLKTAPSQNLGASNFNRVQNAYKTFNTSVSTNYNFYTPTTSRPSTFYSPTTSTAKPDYYTNTAVPTTTRFPQQNYYSTTVKPYTTTLLPSTTQKQTPQYNYYTQPTQNYFAQTTLNNQQDFYKQTTIKAASVNPQTYQSPVTYKQQYYSTTTPRYQQINRGTPLPQSALNQFISSTDATEKPRPFSTLAPYVQPAQPKKSTNNEKSSTATKEKDQYDYAYYDDSPHIEYESIDNVEFTKTKSG